jgi:outer membrane protein assembly factor BamD
VHIVAAFVVLAGLLAACSGKAKPAEDDYSGQAKYSYEEGMEALEGGDYLEASKQFNYVRTKFPYSKYATLATLRVADTHFKQDQYPEAIEAYRRFIQLHPTHPDVPYAQYKIGISFYEELPGDWFFMPPAYEKDLTSTEDAERELRKFLELYPNTQYAEDVGEKLAIVRQRLADHEFFVATFYMQQEQPRAAAMRLQVLLERFPGIGFDQEALFLLGKSYLLLKDVGQAVHTWKQLIDQYPDHPLAVEADNYIRTHDLRVPPPAETETEPAADAPEPPAARLTGSSTDSAEDREPEASPDASPDDVEPPEAYDDPTEETEP